MKKQFDERNLTMVMDFYELTMANGYFKDEDKERKVAFDVFYRKNPDNAGYAIFAGLEQIIEYIENLHFDEDDIEYLRGQGLFGEEFLAYLANFKFKGDIYSFPEGTIMYPNEPVITVVAPLLDAQLVETAILAQINHQSLIATKARRIVNTHVAEIADTVEVATDYRRHRCRGTIRVMRMLLIQLAMREAKCRRI